MSGERGRGGWPGWLAALGLAGCLLLAQAAQAVETVTYFHLDALGSPVAATDADGNVLWREAYRPYGERLRDEAGTDQDLWYTGKPEEGEFGLQYFGARWYDPATGRFQGLDPAGVDPERSVHSFNRYAYAEANPYKYIDPDGREVLLQWHPALGTQYNHTLIRITPENQSRYINDRRFNNIDKSGKRYATIGAGPDFGLNLVSEINRSEDIKPHSNGYNVTPRPGMNEDQYIEHIFTLDSNYNDNLTYDPFPERDDWWPDGYNSNSYPSGLLNASGGTPEDIPDNVPGWDTPVPSGKFKSSSNSSDE